MICSECGQELQESSGPGRFQVYKGKSCEIPSNLIFETCSNCGADWMTSSQIDQLSDSFEKQIDIDPIWEIEYDWGVSFLYKSARLTTQLCCPSEKELAKELRDLAKAVNDAVEYLEKNQK